MTEVEKKSEEVSLIPAAQRLSVSKTKTFGDCKRKFKFAYIEKLPKKEYDFHIYGKFVHKILEDFHLYYINGGTAPYHEAMAIAFKNAVAEFRDKLTAEQKKEAYDSVNQYLKTITLQPVHERPNVLSCEEEFNINIADKVLLVGVIDRVQVDPDGVMHVCDYKTTKNKKYLKNDWFQLLTYAYVLHLKDPNVTRVRGSYILIRHGFEYITTEFDIKDILTIKQKFLDYAHAIDDEKLWRPSPSPLCKYCDFLDSCDDGKKVVYKDSFFGPTSW